jgi:hypothetical protein
MNENSVSLKPLQLINLAKPELITYKIENESHEITFYPCNTTIIKEDENYILNVRYVNYLIEVDQNLNRTYISTPNKLYITVNKYIKLNRNFEEIESKMLFPNVTNLEEKLQMAKEDRNILIGIEDIRLYKFKNNIRYIGSYQYNPYVIGIVHGNYNFEDLNDVNKLLTNLKPEKSIYKNEYIQCEKNWSVYEINDTLFVVYKWYPLQICEVFYDLNYVIPVKKIETPVFFENIRGSSGGFKHENEMWFLTHSVIHDNPNGKYYHVFVIFDLQMNLKKYSQPFRFEGEYIEYCIGFIIENDNFIMTYSINDNCSKLGVYNKKETVDSLTWYSQ